MSIVIKAARSRCISRAVVTVVAGLVLAAPASALSWSAGRVAGHPGFLDVSCATRTLCVAVAKHGKVYVSTHPAAGPGSWALTRHLTIKPNLLSLESTAVFDLACPSANLCVTATGGTIVYSTHPAGRASTWHRVVLDGNSLDTISGISCPSAQLCIALDDLPTRDNNGTVEMFYTTNPAGRASAWHAGPTLIGDTAQGIACRASGLCVAGGQGGVDWVTNFESPGASWQMQQAGSSGEVDQVSCPALSLCLAVPFFVGNGNNDVFSTTPASSNWPEAAVATDSIDCATRTFCVGTGFPGTAVWTTSNPTGSVHAWHKTVLARHGQFLRAVSCSSASFCVAVGDGGEVAVGHR